jgi:hypothetical protein
MGALRYILNQGNEETDAEKENLQHNGNCAANQRNKPPQRPLEAPPDNTTKVITALYSKVDSKSQTS